MAAIVVIELMGQQHRGTGGATFLGIFRGEQLCGAMRLIVAIGIYGVVVVGGSGVVIV